MKEVLNNFKNILTKKNVCLFLIAIILIASFAFIRSNYFNTKDRTVLANFRLDNPILISKNGKYGYIKANGDVFIEPKYIYAEDFHYGYAVVKEKDNEYKIIDKKERVKLSGKATSMPKYYSDYGIWLIDNKLYDNNLHVIFKGDGNLNYISNGFFEFLNNKDKSSGIVSSTGKMTFSWDNDYISVSLSKTVSPNVYGIISDMEENEEIINLKNGKVVYKLEDSKNKYLRESTGGVFRVIDRTANYKTEKWIFIENDKIAYETKDSIYDMQGVSNHIVKKDYGKDYLTLGKTKRIEYYNVDSKQVILDYDIIENDEHAYNMQYYYNYSLSKSGKLYGLKQNNENVLEQKYTSINFLNYGLFKFLDENYKKRIVILEENEKKALYDLNSNSYIKKFNSPSLAIDNNSTFVVATIFKADGLTKDKSIVFNLVTGKEKTFDISREIEVHSNYIKVNNGSTSEYYNGDLEMIYKT